MRGFLIFVAVLVCGIGGLVAIGYLAPHSYVGICRDDKSHQRVPDRDCDSTTNDYGWVYYDSNGDIPAVGQAAEDNIAEGPDKDDTVRRGGVPEEGQQGSSNSDNDGNTGGGFAPGDSGGGSDVGVNSGDEGGDENVGSGGGGEDGE
ncbi:MAG TPA: hypothetical protein VGN81_16355 [Pseudonocardiaceae bacterium]|jgi:hypothetical protein